MLDRTKKFVADHKSHIVTATVAAAVAGAAVYVYYNQKTLLHLPSDVQKRMAAAPEEIWLSYNIAGTVFGLTAIKQDAV